MKHYRVKWEIDVEDTDNPIDAVIDCWRRLRHDDNTWIWQVTDMKTQQVYEVDCEYQEDGNPLVTLVMDINALYDAGWKQDERGDWYHHDHTGQFNLTKEEAWKVYQEKQCKQ